MTPDQFTNRISDIGQRFEREPLTDVMDECHTALVDGSRYMFANAVGPDGEVWPQRRLGTSRHPLLNQTGELYAAATGGAGHVHRTGYREVIYGVQKAASGSRAGAAVHQYGATIVPRFKKFLSFVVDGIRYFAKKVVIPARPYIGCSSETRDICRETIAEGFREKVFQQ
jgi:hypothetical protein